MIRENIKESDGISFELAEGIEAVVDVVDVVVVTQVFPAFVLQ